jgi:Na+:H+ antiporter, NhaA family
MSRTPAKVADFIFDNSLLLLVGTAAAVVWANVDAPSYDAIAHPLHFWVNDVGMVFFFALAAKQVFEATLPGGPLASPRRALSPLAAAVGGMAAPALIYAALASTRGPADLIRGWAASLHSVRWPAIPSGEYVVVVEVVRSNGNSRLVYTGRLDVIGFGH